MPTTPSSATPRSRHRSRSRAIAARRCLLGRFAVAVGEFGENPGHGVVIGRRGQFAVGLQPQAVRIDVLDGMCASTGRSIRTSTVSSVCTVCPSAAARYASTASPTSRTYRSKPTPATCPDCSAPRTFPAPRNSRSFKRDGHTGTEFVVLRDRRQPVISRFGERLFGTVQQIRIAAFPATANASGQLMQLRQAEVLGPVDDQRVGVGDIETGLDNRRTHEHIEVAVPESAPSSSWSRSSAHAPQTTFAPGNHCRDLFARSCRWWRPDYVRRTPDRRAAVHGESPRSPVGSVRTDAIGQHRMPVPPAESDRRHLPDTGHRHLQVRGIGVADIVSIIHVVRNDLMCSCVRRRTVVPRRRSPA